MNIAELGCLIAALRKLAQYETRDPESMSRGYGRALTDAANLLDDLLNAEIDHGAA
jgi:hypothetical protein